MGFDGGVPEGDVVGDVSDAEEAVAGAEDLNLVAVAHERVGEIGGGGEGGEAGVDDGEEAGVLAEDEEDIRFGGEGSGDV